MNNGCNYFIVFVGVFDNEHNFTIINKYCFTDFNILRKLRISNVHTLCSTNAFLGCYNYIVAGIQLNTIILYFAYTKFRTL